MGGIKQHRIPAEGTLAPSKDSFLPIETTPHDGVRRDPWGSTIQLGALSPRPRLPLCSDPRGQRIYS